MSLIMMKQVVTLPLCLALVWLVLTWCSASFDPQAIKLVEDAKIIYDSWDYDEALKFLDSAISIEPKLYSAHYQKWLTLSAKWQLEDAIKSYDTTLTLEPWFLTAMTDKAMSLSKLWKHEESTQLLDQALSRDPADIYALHNKWFNQYLQGEYDAAVDFYDQALAYSGGFIRAHVHKGIATADAGDYVMSLQSLDRALELWSGDYLNRYNKWTILSDLWYQDKEWSYTQQALDHFNKTLALNPNFIDALVAKAIVEFDLQKYEDALTTVNTALIKDDVNIDWLYYKWLILSYLDKPEESKAIFKKVLELNPAHGYAKQELDLLEKATREDTGESAGEGSDEK